MLISNELFSIELKTNNVIDFFSLSKSRFVTSRLPVTSIKNEWPSVLIGNVDFNPVLSDNWTASANGIDIDTDLSPIELSLAFALSHQTINVHIVGTTNLSHLKSNIKLP